MSLEPIIPLITDPLGRHWKQPPLSSITFRKGAAWMTLATFEALAEYSATNPTGAYEGKMWRRHDGVYDENFRSGGGIPNCCGGRQMNNQHDFAHSESLIRARRFETARRVAVWIFALAYAAAAAYLIYVVTQ